VKVSFPGNRDVRRVVKTKELVLVPSPRQYSGDDYSRRRRGLAHLEMVGLNETKLTYAGLAHLGGLAGIRQLYLTE
jgi:hypothetical protein